MKRATILLTALFAVLLAVGGIAYADKGVPAGDSLFSPIKVHDGQPLPAGAVGHQQLQMNIVSCEKFTNALRGKLCHHPLRGLRGVRGPQGTAGAAGKAGAVGMAGAVGTAGANGTTGAKGDTGAKGAGGATGSAGAKGDTGAIG